MTGPLLGEEARSGQSTAADNTRQPRGGQMMLACSPHSRSRATRGDSCPLPSRNLPSPSFKTVTLCCRLSRLNPFFHRRPTRLFAPVLPASVDVLVASSVGGCPAGYAHNKAENTSVVPESALRPLPQIGRLFFFPGLLSVLCQSPLLPEALKASSRSTCHLLGQSYSGRRVDDVSCFARQG